MRHAAGDGDDLVGKGGYACAEHDPCPPFVVFFLKAGELLCIAIKLYDGFSDRIVKKKADGVAKNAAKYGADGANGGVIPRFLPVREAHGDQHDVRRDRKDGTFNERYARQGPERTATSRLR